MQDFVIKINENLMLRIGQALLKRFLERESAIKMVLNYLKQELSA